jgi:predicted AlkP superfamily phosphohydrolase/phosphomutase
VSEVEGIRINVKSRYPNGTVEAEEYEALRAAIIERVKTLNDPESGDRVFTNVYKREQVYSGESIDEFPDIILRPDDRYKISPKLLTEGGVKESFLAREEHWRKISGSHRQHGIFIIKGRDYRRGVRLDEVPIVDILPTALYEVGVPLPDDLDGKPVEGAFKEQFLQAHRVEVETTKDYDATERADIYSEEEKSKLVDSLRGLGYIE